MTRVWEDTIVTALRDAQWINCQGTGNIPKAQFPSAIVKLDGIAESSLGDVLYSVNERYFLLEVKGHRKDVPSEWRGATGENQKMAYKSLSAMWCELQELCSANRTAEDTQQLERLRKFFTSSFACHHFVYWDEWVNSKGKFGEIVVESYVPACAKAYDCEVDKGSEFITPWTDNYFGFIRGDAKDGYVSEVVGLLDIFTLPISVCFQPANNVNVIPIGLRLAEFQRYINLLLREWGGEDQEIHAVVLSSSGSFFKVAGSTNELKLLLNQDSELYSSPRKVPKHRKSRVVGQAPRS